MKFGGIPPNTLGDVISRKLLTEEGHPVNTIVHLEPMAQVSLKQ